jgi:polysaccharide biosynthesis/export protein
MEMITARLVILLAAGCSVLAAGQTPITNSSPPHAEYRLGPDDEISIDVPALEEIGSMRSTVDAEGNIFVPLAGTLHVEGQTLEQVREALTKDLSKFLREPIVKVGMNFSRSQPVSVLGAVNKPDIYQLQGHRDLVEVLSMAGGLREDAGNRLKLTRRSGAIPLPNAVFDETCGCSTVEIPVKSLLDARDASLNIPLRRNDIVSVPRAETVYVVGAVRQPGGFPIREERNLSVLQALSLAGGLDRVSAPKAAKIIRRSEGGKERQEIAVDLRRVLGGTAEDIAMKPSDILFVPSSTSKSATYRGLEALLQMGTGVVIFRR